MKTLIFLVGFLFLGFVPKSLAKIDLNIIQEIESHGNPKAFNKRSGARGLYQITPICLKHFNSVHGTDYSLEMLFDVEINTKIAKWYISWLEERCDSDKEVLIAYNFGLKNMRRWKAGEKQLPKETSDYLIKYEKGKLKWMKKNKL